MVRKYPVTYVSVLFFIIVVLLGIIFLRSDEQKISQKDFVMFYWPLFSPFISGLLGGALPFFALRWAVRSFRISQERLRRERAIDVLGVSILVSQ